MIVQWINYYSPKKSSDHVLSIFINLKWLPCFYKIGPSNSSAFYDITQAIFLAFISQTGLFSLPQTHPCVYYDDLSNWYNFPINLHQSKFYHPLRNNSNATPSVRSNFDNQIWFLLLLNLLCFLNFLILYYKICHICIHTSLMYVFVLFKVWDCELTSCHL